MRSVWLAAVLALVCACTSSVGESSSPPHRPAEIGPPPGTTLPTSVFDKVDIGGYRLAYECLGTGTPTIVAVSGYDTGGTTEFAGILGALAGVSRVCMYDRAGTGNSDERPRRDAEGLTSEDQARELHALLQAAHVQPPYVLAAHSYGGFVSRLFAAMYPREVHGLVLIESSHKDEIAAYVRYYRRQGNRMPPTGSTTATSSISTPPRPRSVPELGTSAGCRSS
jgi:pimeloyl-ACP methyl ester carboxylesterase